MRIRTAALIGCWGLALGVATAVSWAAVSLVGNQVSPSGSTPLSQAEVERRIHAGSTSGSASTGGGATSSAAVTAGTPVRRSVVVQGGTVVLVCTGDRVTARTSPRSGYTVAEGARSEGTEIEITFSGGSHRSRVEGSCRSGVPTASVQESDHERDDD